MKFLTLIFLLLVAPALSARAADPIPDILRRAKSRIDSLLSNRRSASPAPAKPANPFVLPEPVSTHSDTGPTSTIAAPTKADTLTRLAASLNVSGFLQIQGVPHLIINRLAYRENDLVPVRDTGGSVLFLRLKKITEGNFILELDDMELEQKHTVK